MEYVPDTLEISFFKNYNTEIIISIIIVIVTGIVCFFMNRSSSSKQKIPKIIWIYWHEPIGKAPEIVQICINIVKSYTC